MADSIRIYLVSDSVGETVQKMVAAVSAQFPALYPLDVRQYPFVIDEAVLCDVLSEVKRERGILVFTMVNHQLVAIIREFCAKEGIDYVDCMTPLIDVIAKRAGVLPLQKPGTLHKLDSDYFNRVAAIEFAVKYDDGKDPKGFLQADYVLLGVSRTSKTPLSMYLANQGIRVANWPLVPEAPIPRELYKVAKEKMVGLTAGINTISRIRRSRLQALQLEEGSSYSDAKRIQEELRYAQMIFEELDIPVINVDNQAIEEIAATITKGKRFRSF